MDSKPPPPPVIGSPASPRPRRSRGRIWPFILMTSVGLVALLILIGSLLTTFGFRGDRHLGRQSGRIFEEVSVEDNRSRNKILVIDVEGMITSRSWDRTGRNMVDVIEDQLNEAAEDSAVRAVILKVDSPGGEVIASDDISRSLTEFQTNARKPVVAAMGGLAASGGYYIAAPCQWIVANELTITGSIGVILQSFNYRGLLDKVGVYPQVFKSGKFKDMLGGSKKPEEISPEAEAMIQQMVDQTFTKFKKVVAEGRARAQKVNKGAGRALAENWEDHADGRILTGTQAYELGFVDELGGFASAVERAQVLAGIADANLIRYQEPFHLGRFLGFLGKSETRALKLEIGTAPNLPKLEPGRLYFLSPTVLY